jgi:surface antigen
MKYYTKNCLIWLIAFVVSGCGQQEVQMIAGTVGSVAGGAFGGTIGSLAGGAAAGLVGKAGYNAFVTTDIERQEEIVQQALNNPDTKTLRWTNKDTKASGSVQAGKAHLSPDGKRCRIFHQRMVVGQKEFSDVNIACRKDENNEWDIVEV